MRHVRAFLAVAEELHFGRAAKRLGIVQPAVSAAIRQLEDEVGAVLFDRTQRKVTLSAAGAHFRHGAVEALAALEDGARNARRAAQGQTGRVVVHFSAMAALWRLPNALARFRKQRPDVQVIVAQKGTRQQLEAVRDGSCDIAFAIMPGDVSPLSAAELPAEPLAAVLPAGHRFARSKSLALADAVREPMIILPRASEPAITDAYRRLCASFEVEPNVVMELDQVEAMLAFIAAGIGIALMPASIARLGFRGVAVVPLRPRIPAEGSLVWDPERLSPAGHALVRELLSNRKGVAT